MHTRRRFLAHSAAALAAAFLSRKLRAGTEVSGSALSSLLSALEERCAGRLGVAVLDPQTGEWLGWREDERFAMCSTFKLLLAASILQRVDRGLERTDRSILVPPKPLLVTSPVTEQHAGERMPVGALCEAIVTRSDNTAANLLLETVGGPDAVTRFARSIGDEVTRLDRPELALNEATPGDPRDTTTPRAMARNLETLLVKDLLAPASREQLIAWMVESRSGIAKLRSALPAGWRAGDKTGANGSTTSNDIAIAWRPDGRPLLIAAYLTECPGPEAKRASVLAETGRLVFSAKRA
ncbi:class A beta-lactamase [Opitutaceae bacterium EW11]|nr:class A beta-lactamase [Opitutaceae bacterium EW11]